MNIVDRALSFILRFQPQVARQTRPRYEEPQCVTLSSDEDDAEDAASESAALAAASAAVAAALDGQPEAKKSKPTPAAAQLPPLKAANGLAPRTYQRKTAVRFENKMFFSFFQERNLDVLEIYRKPPCFSNFLVLFHFNLGILIS